MAATARCEKCGADLVALATEEFCTACLLEKGLREPSADRARTDRGSTLGLFGEYELLEEISRGGMGVVYKARQVRLDRTVALKMILTGHLASAREVQRFLAEARTAASLQHPNIVAIHEVGEQDGQPFFSMDYVEGPNLSQLVGASPLPAKRAARYVQRVAEAVHYAHQRGVLHRDLKSSNVLVDARDEPLVTDFGLAKRLNSSPLSPPTSDLTLSGQVLGSPNFMPPEQAAGKRDELEPSSDVYSLGAILFHLLTGRPPFLADSMTATLRLVAEAEPTSPRLLVPTLPRDLETICLKCLDKLPARRYVSAQELAEELGRFLRDEPIVARPVGRVEKVIRWCHRHPALALVSTLAFLLLIAIVAISTTAAIQLKTANREARDKLRDSYLAQARANRWSGRVGRRFDSLEALQKAAEIRPGLDLRNEAIAALPLVDFRPIKSWNLPAAGNEVFDDSLKYYAVTTDTTGLKEVVVRRLDGNREVLRLAHPKQRVLRTVFFGEGRWFTVLTETNRSQSLKVYDLTTARLYLEWSGQSFTAWDVSRDAKSLALFLQRDGEAKRIALWDLSARRERLAFEPEAAPNRIRFRPDGAALALDHQGDPVIEIRSTRDGLLLERIPTDKPAPGFDWCYDGALQSALGAGHEIQLSHLAVGSSQHRKLAHGHHVSGTQFNHRGDLLVSVGWNDLLRLWNPHWGTELLSAPAAGYCMGAFSSDDSQMLRWDAVSLQLCELAGGRECDLLPFPQTQRADKCRVFFSPDSRQLVLANSDSATIWHQDTTEITAWSVLSEEMPQLLAIDWQNHAALGRSGSDLVRMEWTCGTDGSIQAGPTTAFAPMPLTELVDGRFVGNSEDRKLLVDANSDMRLLDAHSGRELRRFGTGHARFASENSPDGRWLATWTLNSKAVRIWNLNLGQPVRELPISSSELAFSPDSRCLVTGSPNEYVAWSTANWRRLWTVPRGTTGGARGRIAFSADGGMVAVTSKGESIRLCRTTDGAELATLEAPDPRRIISLLFRPDGQQLLALTDDGIRVWQLLQIRKQLTQLHLDWDTPGPCPSPALTNRDADAPAQGATVLLPARDERCGKKQIDLSNCYNGTFDDFQFFTGVNGNDLAAVPKGFQILAGTAFDLRGVIQLIGHDKYPGPAPAEVNGIPVRQTCRTLSFLHSSLFALSHGVSRGATMGEYTVHYTDGRSEIIPLKYEKNIGDWWQSPSSTQMAGPGTCIAWRGANAASQRVAEHINIVLFKDCWENPHPSIPIASIDFRSTRGGAAPFLVALTAE